DEATVPKDGAALVDVRANDTPGPANESPQALSVQGASAPAHGSALPVSAGTDAGKVRYVPEQGYAGPDTFSYTVCDDGSPSQCGTATVHVTVTRVNHAPTAFAGTASLLEDAAPLPIDLGALVSDA